MKKEVVSFVLFGGTGDLTRRKLVPAFADLVHRGELSERSTIIGISRKDLTDKQYKKFLIDSISGKKEKAHIKKMDVKYIKGDFSKPGGIGALKKELAHCEITGCNRIYYLSTSYNFFPVIVKELKRLGLSKVVKGFTRVMFEKPFGSGLKSSEKLDRGIHSVFKEKDVYRIDHYLAKETVLNLNTLLFSNPILYSTLNNKFVESVEIRVDESLGVGNRLEYYNESGALRDMVQNHLLQVLSLVLMDLPKSLKPEKVHDEKVKVLKKLELSDIKKQVFGQYASYASELKKKGLKDKKTETFVKLELNCKSKRWDGVPLILRTGKKLPDKKGCIEIKFKPSLLNKSSGSNRLVIDIYPKQDATLWLNSRDTHSKGMSKPVKFEFCRECVFGPNTADEYSVLIDEAVSGNKTLFARDDEVKEAWKIVDSIEKVKKKCKFIVYKDEGDPED
ncbi:MAG: glucose-6-phosphate dehydrogenase [Colwelliaceae bacterium]|nr:glucose-6-phosphate dehydrogenase [Colwelliaceae bacterium]|tara:strand:+ start:825 stop:2168 length:1344 start_codon:yes stop_codon:yes gene_type:complete